MSDDVPVSVCCVFFVRRQKRGKRAGPSAITLFSMVRCIAMIRFVINRTRCLSLVCAGVSLYFTLFHRLEHDVANWNVDADILSICAVDTVCDVADALQSSSSAFTSSTASASLPSAPCMQCCEHPHPSSFSEVALSWLVKAAAQNLACAQVCLRPISIYYNHILFTL